MSEGQKPRSKCQKLQITLSVIVIDIPIKLQTGSNQRRCSKQRSIQQVTEESEIRWETVADRQCSVLHHLLEEETQTLLQRTAVYRNRQLRRK